MEGELKNVNIVYEYNSSDSPNTKILYGKLKVKSFKDDEFISFFKMQILDNTMVEDGNINKYADIVLKDNFEIYQVEGIKFSTIPAYNTNKTFHPKENNWVGYTIELEGSKYYIAGDTDITEENKKVKCDVAFVPVGGTYKK